MMNRLFLAILMIVFCFSISSSFQLRNFTYVQAGNIAAGQGVATYDLTNNTDHVWFYDWFDASGIFHLHNSIADMQGIITRDHNLGHHFFSSLQNGNDNGKSYFNIVGQTDAAMRVGIGQMMTIHRQVHYDGVGLDIEAGMQGATQAQWDNFFKAISDSLHSNGEKFFAYVPQHVGAPCNSLVARQSFDYILVNGYDFNYTVSWNGEHYGLVGMSTLRDPGNCGITNLHENDSTAIVQWIAVGYSPGQIGEGIPYYGRAWTMYKLNANFCDPMLALQSTYVLYDEIVNSRLKNFHTVSKFNAQTGTTILVTIDTTGLKGGDPWAVEIPDYNALKAHIDFAKKMGLFCVYGYSSDWAELRTVPVGHRKYEFLELINQLVGSGITPPPPPNYVASIKAIPASDTVGRVDTISVSLNPVVVPDSTVWTRGAKGTTLLPVVTTKGASMTMFWTPKTSGVWTTHADVHIGTQIVSTSLDITAYDSLVHVIVPPPVPCDTLKYIAIGKSLVDTTKPYSDGVVIGTAQGKIVGYGLGIAAVNVDSIAKSNYSKGQLSINIDSLKLVGAQNALSLVPNFIINTDTLKVIHTDTLKVPKPQLSTPVPGAAVVKKLSIVK